MISSAPGAGRRLPSPSAVSARPSRCSPPVSKATSATASTEPSSRRATGGPSPARATTEPPSAPSSRPTPGIHSTAPAASPGPSEPPVPAGITVNRLSAFRAAENLELT